MNFVDVDIYEWDFYKEKHVPLCVTSLNIDHIQMLKENQDQKNFFDIYLSGTRIVVNNKDFDKIRFAIVKKQMNDLQQERIFG